MVIKNEYGTQAAENFFLAFYENAVYSGLWQRLFLQHGLHVRYQRLQIP